MRLIVSDVNIEGHVRAMVRMLQQGEWSSLFDDLEIRVLTFDDLGLVGISPDRMVWGAVQARGAMLITDNRNKDGRDSLQYMIETANAAESVPVVTLSDSTRFLFDNEYANRAVDRLIEILFDWEKNLGTGRLFIP